jgi:thiol-disulfide isomerase/thioredoxin
MKKIIAFAITCIVSLTVFAQENGMQFEHNSSWEKVLAKAKNENKYIFVDCYTTWCGPCKVMSSTIFPLENVGTFYNKNYVNVKMQFDQTKNDNEDIKSWFATCSTFEKEYKINAYPTYLIFSPSGELVHRAVGSMSAESFITIGKNGMDEQAQYYTLKKTFEDNTNNTPDFLLKMTNAALAASEDDFAKIVSKKYLATQKDMLTKDNLKLLLSTTNSSKDEGFKILLKNQNKIDNILGNKETNGYVNQIIIQEELNPLIYGKSVKPMNWTNFEKNITKKYPTKAKEILLASKIIVAQKKQNWKEYGPLVNDYLNKYGNFTSANEINSYAWTIFEKCEDAACVTNALSWSKKSFEANNNHMFMDTYANLLHKNGKTKEAIEWETKAKEIAEKAGEDASDYAKAIEKMKKGEKTW